MYELQTRMRTLEKIEDKDREKYLLNKFLNIKKW